MNENPGETSNPLNPNNNPLDANPAESTPLEKVVEEVQTASAAPAGDPMARPMEQAPAVAPVQPKKKKTGLIVGIIIAAVVLIGGGIAAALILMNLNRGDAVSKAIEKLASGNVPANVKMDGTFTLVPNDEDSLISNVKIDLDMQASTSSLMNSATATLTANFTNGGSFEFDLDEVYAANGDLYFKISGLTNALEDYTTSLQGSLLEDEYADTNYGEDLTVIVDCEETGDCEPVDTTGDDAISLESLTEILSLIEAVDGEWLRISTDDLSTIGGLTTTDSDTSCLVNLMGDAKSYNNSIAEMYGKNPFITSTTEGVTLASKSGEPVYKVVIDEEKFSTFINDFQDSTLAENLLSCMGYEGMKVDTDDLAEEISEWPTFYVEVDKDYNFTRLYFVADSTDGSTTLTTDLSFTYPENINVAEPAEYTDFSVMLQRILTSMYALPGTEDVVE